MSKSLSMFYIRESTFARIFLFLERTLQHETHIYINLHTLFLLFLSSFDNNFILIGHSKQCVQSRRTRGVLKIERYAEKLTRMREASSDSWAPDLFTKKGNKTSAWYHLSVFSNVRSRM